MQVVWNGFGRYGDSPRALYEALVTRAPGVSHTWLARPGAENGFPPGVRIAPLTGAGAVEVLEQADLVVSNDHLDVEWQKRPGATYLQTWHGTPLKRIHHDVLWAPPGRLDRLDRDVARWDVLLSPNAASTERLRGAFAFAGPVHETGYPRNDLLTSGRAPAVRAALRERLGIADGTTAVLYAPTWRDDLVYSGAAPATALTLDPASVAARLGTDHVLLLRLHSMVLGALGAAATGPAVLDVSAHPDVAELYLAADVLVTDYSSVMFDFAVTGKPIVLYVPDLDRYRDETRGFYFDLADQAPGPLVRDVDSLVAALLTEDVAPDVVLRRKHFDDTFCHLEDGRATERVLRLLPPTTDHRPNANDPQEAS